LTLQFHEVMAQLPGFAEQALAVGQQWFHSQGEATLKDPRQLIHQLFHRGQLLAGGGELLLQGLLPPALLMGRKNTLTSGRGGR
jgi:hypothetical protein